MKCYYTIYMAIMCLTVVNLYSKSSSEKNNKKIIKQQIIEEIKNGRKNLSGVDLSYTDLSHLDLSNADLSNAKLMSANCEYTNLDGANLHKANLTAANFEDATLKNADLSGACLKRTNFNYADLTDTIINNSTTMRDTTFYCTTGVSHHKKWHEKVREWFKTTF